MKVGVTGTRSGCSPSQKKAVQEFLERILNDAKKKGKYLQVFYPTAEERDGF